MTPFITPPRMAAQANWKEKRYWRGWTAINLPSCCEGIKEVSDPMRVAMRIQESLAVPFSANGVDVFYLCQHRHCA